MSFPRMCSRARDGSAAGVQEQDPIAVFVLRPVRVAINNRIEPRGCWIDIQIFKIVEDVKVYLSDYYNIRGGEIRQASTLIHIAAHGPHRGQRF